MKESELKLLEIQVMVIKWELSCGEFTKSERIKKQDELIELLMKIIREVR